MSAQELSVPDDHPASPRAPAGPLMASLALGSYRSAADFAAASPATAGGGADGLRQVAQAGGAKPFATGTVNGVNAARRTVNLSHEPIPSIGWPAMTMDLPVGPSVDLRTVRPGSRVRFTLARGPDDLYLIDSITAVPPGAGGAGSGGASGTGSAPGMGGMPGMGHGGMGGSPPAPGGPPRPQGTQ